MNPDIKELWLKALRSGEFRKGTGMLKSPDGAYCCLGVLCELAVQAGIITEPQPPYASDEGWRYESEPSVLPPTVRKWAGLPHDNPMVVADDRMYCVAVLNDDVAISGDDFTVIADWIERSL